MTHASRTAAGRRWLLAAGALLALTACAAVPVPPTAALQAAETAIANAEQARVTEYAALELGEARQELAAARAAVQREQMVLAERLALESRASAELAMARAEAGKAKAVNDDLRKSTESLEQELQRNSGARP